MAKVIVPKNHVMSTGMSSAVMGTSILGSTTTIGGSVFMEDGYLGLEYSINYGSADSTYSINNTSSTYRYITIKNANDFGCNFVILKVSGLPKYKNIGTAVLYIRLRLTLSSGTNIILKTLSIASGGTGSGLNMTYCVNLIDNTVYTGICDIAHKAITPSSSIWLEPAFTKTFTTTSTDVSFDIDSPYPYLINNYRLDFNTTGTTTSGTLLITVNNLTENNRYLKLYIGGLLSVSNTSTSLSKFVYTKLKIGTTTLTLGSTSIAAGKTGGFPMGTYYIDLINKTVISSENTKKAITQL